MGGGSSVAVTLEQTEEELTELMMPPYFIRNVVVTEDDIKLGRASWKLILDGRSRVFLELKSTTGHESASCLTWFYDSFYTRLFDVNPSARPLFKTNLQSQGRVLMGVISTALNQLKDPDSFNQMLVNLAHVHSQRGVRGMQYGIIGDVLFWTLHKCLGPEFDAQTAVAWTKIFSYMLHVIVPVAVADEIREVKAAMKALKQQKTVSEKTSKMPTISEKSSVKYKANNDDEVHEFDDIGET